LTVFKKPKIIYMVDIGLPSFIASALLKIFSLGKIKVILDSGDMPYYMAKHESYIYPFLFRKIILSIIYLTEELSYKISDKIIVRGTYYKTYLVKKRYNQSKILFLPDGVDCNIFKPMNVNALRKKLGIKGYLTLGVIGHLFWDKKYQFSYGSYMIESLKYVKDLPVKAIIIGAGKGLPKLRELSKKTKVSDKVIFTGRIPHEKVPHYLNLIDVYIFTNSPAFLNNQIRTTAKLPELLATGRFIISSNVIEAKRTIRENGFILKFNGIKDKHYAKKLAKKIRYIYTHKEIIKKGNIGVRLAKKEYDYRILSYKLKNILSKIE
jgi:hypothetical protein